MSLLVVLLEYKFECGLCCYIEQTKMKIATLFLGFMSFSVSQELSFSNENPLQRKWRDLSGWNRYTNTLRRLALVKTENEAMKRTQYAYLAQIKNFLRRQRNMN